ncbi:hypothetical protein EXS66_02745 [Candidatus Saccharibacteria bacterium]|nr:hypothetical protein [Candidatus Saccharibacteria bacterium]
MQPNQPNPAQQEYANSVTPTNKKKGELLSTQSHLNFAEVRDGVVIMRDGSLRMIVMCSPTNYDLKSGGEKEAIEFAYQGFLNGLHFPIQICIQSRKIDLDGYLDKLDQMLSDQANPLLAELMEDYIFNVRELLNVANIMDKKFFVVIPYFVIEEAKGNVFKQIAGTLSSPKDVSQTDQQFTQRKNELMLRTSMVAQGLASIGVRAAVLKTQEVIELYYGSYNVDESQNQALVDTGGMTTAAVARDGAPAGPYTPPPKEQEPPDLYASAKQQAPPGGTS